MTAPLQKWATLQKIDADCWEQVGASGHGCPVWQLKADWLRVMFKGTYASIRACAGAGLQPMQAICFVTPGGVHELRVFSRVRPGEYYDSTWQFGEPAGAEALADIGHAQRRRLVVPLSNGEGPIAPANAIWIFDPSHEIGNLTEADYNVRIFCPPIDETIDVNARSLDVRFQESVGERQMRLVPWQRLLVWMQRLRQLDKSAYRRINKPLRSWLDSRDCEQRIATLGEAEIGMMQQQGMLPPYIAWLTPEEAPQMAESIRLQQGIARRKDVLLQYANLMRLPNFSPIPALLMQVDPARLDLLDLQVFMTIGALREIHGFVEVETQRLLQRRPDLQTAMQNPQGGRGLQSDPEVAALNAHPRAVAEQQDAQDLMLRKAGSYGPTTRELMVAGQVMMNIGNQQLSATMLLGGGAGMLFGLDATNQYIAAALAEGPPWKIYVPYIC
jgi:hypothetical protein